MGELSSQVTSDRRLSKMAGRVRANAVAAFALGCAILLASLAAHSDRPITSAMVLLFGVTLVGAVGGIKLGLGGAVLASIIYNFFLSDPAYRFSISSADELVPLVALNISAIASALVAGRLRDRALAAERAAKRIQFLMNVSERLQRAVTLEDIVAAIRETGSGALQALELYSVRQGALRPVGSSAKHREAAADMAAHSSPYWRYAGCEAFQLRDGERVSGVLVLRSENGAAGASELEALASLVNIAFQRCLALEELAEAALVRKSEEFKTALLSSVSHDLRTPLSAIAAAASSLRSYGSDLPAAVRDDFINVIEEQSARLDRYTANLLSLGRIQAGLGDAARTSCDALEALGSAIAAVRSLRPGVDLRKAFAVQEAPVLADPVMLEQVFYNVLENALKYSPEETPITVGASADGGNVRIWVIDQGRGIAEAERGRVFDRFYRGHADRRSDGSGLGLSIAKGFVEAFGGSIAVEPGDPLGQGTRVTISLPLSPEKSAE